MYFRDLSGFWCEEENEEAAIYVATVKETRAVGIVVQRLFIPRRARARAREAVP
jgi:hypothetical protein